jgi:hypothetical protein
LRLPQLQERGAAGRNQARDIHLSRNRAPDFDVRRKSDFSTVSDMHVALLASFIGSTLVMVFLSLRATPNHRIAELLAAVSWILLLLLVIDGRTA